MLVRSDLKTMLQMWPATPLPRNKMEIFTPGFMPNSKPGQNSIEFIWLTSCPYTANLISPR